MTSRREKTPPKRMRRIALVICEGETEENYTNLLKKCYKSPIRIISHIEGSKIPPSLVDNRTRELKISPWDKVDTFLMYDMDVPTINEKLQACKANLLLSNPCFELWLLLHSKDQKSYITTESVIKELKKSAAVWRNYNKATFTDTQQNLLKDNLKTALIRAKNLINFQNPSTNVYKLIEVLESSANG